jgi:hypothetical protein
MLVKPTVLTSIFSIEPKTYTHFIFDAAAADTVRTVILAFAVGILLASLAAFYHKNVPGAIVRSILRASATDPENAKTLEELGLSKNFFFRYELRHNVTLKKLIIAVTSVEKTENGEEEYTVTRYYIPEEKKFIADTRFEKKGSGPAGLLLGILLIAALTVLLIRLVPVVLSIIDTFMK